MACFARDPCDVWRISLPGCLLRSLVRGSGCSWRGRPLYPPAACWATPLERAPFLSRLLPLRACISLCYRYAHLSPSSLRAACPRQNDEKCLDLKKPQGDPALCAISKTSSGPRYVQTAAENCRGVGAFLCVVLGFDSGLTMCKTYFIKL